jgi:serine-type D-Ala-D-Ala carboxypeptidase (penicillin-binding protein 5/6)
MRRTALVFAAVLATALTLAAAAGAAPALGVRSAILVAPQTGQQLDGVDPDARLAIASTTKLMTALLTLQHARFSTIFHQNDWVASSVDSQIGLQPGEAMSVHDLLVALMLPSADDAAEDLAYNVGGHSVARFVSMMNAQARALGLTHTHYTTPSGLDTPGNYSSARDLTTLAQYLLTHYSFFARLVDRPSAVIRIGSRSLYVTNRNDLVGRVPWINGVKTGHTSQAGYVLVASADRGGLKLLSAVLGTSSESTRDGNTMALLDYGYAHFTLAHPVRAGQVLARPTVRYRSGTRAELVAATGIERVVPRGARVTLQIQAPKQLSGPQRARSRHGQVVVLVNGRPVSHAALVLARALPSVSPLTVAAKTFIGPTTLFLLAVLVVCAVLVRRRRRKRSRRRAPQPA